MKKARLITLTLVAVCMLCVMAFAGCEDKEHVHTYADKWSSNEAEHWHAATCEHGDEKADTAKHTFGEWSTVTEASCSGGGTRSRKCTVCGYEEVENTPATAHTYSAGWKTDKDAHWHEATCEHTSEQSDYAAHDFGDWTETKAANCTENGSHFRKCKTCEYVDTQGIPASHGHITHTDAEGKTCTTDGAEEYWSCDDCGQKFSDEACTHKIDDVVVVPASHGHITHTDAAGKTCTTAGAEEYWTCGDCGQKFSDAACTHKIDDVVVVPASHGHISHTGAVGKTCATDGAEEYWSCDDCGQKFADEACTQKINAAVVIPASHGNITKTDANQNIDNGTIAHPRNTNGKRAYKTCEYWTCDDCGKHYADEALTKEITVLSASSSRGGGLINLGDNSAYATSATYFALFQAPADGLYKVSAKSKPIKQVFAVTDTGTGSRPIYNNSWNLNDNDTQFYTRNGLTLSDAVYAQMKSGDMTIVAFTVTANEVFGITVEEITSNVPAVVLHNTVGYKVEGDINEGDPGTLYPWCGWCDSKSTVGNPIAFEKYVDASKHADRLKWYEISTGSKYLVFGSDAHYISFTPDAVGVYEFTFDFGGESSAVKADGVTDNNLNAINYASKTNDSSSCIKNATLTVGEAQVGKTVVFHITPQAASKGGYFVKVVKTQGLSEGENTVTITETYAYVDVYKFVPTATKKYSMTVPAGFMVTMDGEDFIVDGTAKNFEATSGKEILFAFYYSQKGDYTVNVGAALPDQILVVGTKETVSIPSGGPAKGKTSIMVGSDVAEGTYLLTIKPSNNLGRGYLLLAVGGDPTFEDMYGTNSVDGCGVALSYMQFCTQDSETYKGDCNTRGEYHVIVTLKAGDIIHLAQSGTTSGTIDITMTAYTPAD